MTQKIKILLGLMPILIIGFLTLSSSFVFADNPCTGQPAGSSCGQPDSSGSSTSNSSSSDSLDPGNTISSTAPAASNPACNGQPNQTTLNDCLKHNSLINDLNDIVDFLSGLVAVIVTIMLVVGGIQYSLAGDSPEATAKAKKRITNALFALVAFFFIFAFLNWLIPGGIFG